MLWNINKIKIKNVCKLFICSEPFSSSVFFFTVVIISNIYDNLQYNAYQNSTKLISTIDSIANHSVYNTQQQQQKSHRRLHRMRMQLLINNFLHHKYFQTITNSLTSWVETVIYPCCMPSGCCHRLSHYFSIVHKSVNHFTSVTKMHVISWNTRLILKAKKKTTKTKRPKP